MKSNVEKHPEITVHMEVDCGAYEEVGVVQPKGAKAITATGLMDTGAQLTVIPMSEVYKMGLKKENLIPVKMKAKGANEGGIRLVGGLLLKMSGKHEDGTLVSTSELIYVSPDCKKFLLSKGACADLGIIPGHFPRVGIFQGSAIEEPLTGAKKPLMKDLRCKVNIDGIR